MVAIACVAAALAMLGGAWAPARAQVDEPFTVRALPVDATADTAANARVQALADGQRRALRRVFERIVLSADLARLPRLNDRAIEALVQALEVDKERTSSVRYLAELTYRFKPAEVRGLLRQSAIRFAETRSRPVLVLPVLRDGPETLLWEEANAWRRTWAELPPIDGLVPLIVPIGDLTDGDTIGAAAALAGDEEKLAAIMARYRASEVVVALAETSPAGPSGVALQITVARYGSALSPEAMAALAPSQPPARSTAPLAERMAAAARALAQRIEDAWKLGNVVQFGQEQQLSLILPLAGGLGDLVEARQRLAGLPAVSRVDVNALTRQMARLIVTFSGEPQQLQAAAVQKDMTLTPDAPDWQLSLARPQAQQATPPQPPLQPPAAAPPGSQ